MMTKPEEMESAPPAEFSLPATQFSLNEWIAKRWSPRAFAQQPVEPEKLAILFEAAHWAASSMNEQPWRFLVARKSNAAEFQKMLSVLDEFNQVWAKNAPVLAISLAHRNFTLNGKPNRFALHDTGMALANLMIQATELGLHVHAMGGFDAAKTREVYQVPEDFEVGAAFVIGYLGDPGSLPDKLRDREIAPRVRKPLEELVFHGSFGTPIRL